MTTEDYSSDDFEDLDASLFDAIDQELIDAAKAELYLRCSKARIDVKEDDFFGTGSEFAIFFECGREKRKFETWDYGELRSLLDVPFEKYRFLVDYNAICSYDDREIEALVKPMGPLTRISHLYLKLFGFTYNQKHIDEGRFSVTLTPKSGTNLPGIHIGPASKTLQVLTKNVTDRPFISIKLSNIETCQHDSARELLEKVSNSVFFQIELLSGIALSLLKEKKAPRKSKKRQGSLIGLQYPNAEYDAAPISLYWYGKSAIGMPLLQFLAFYQAIEFYFPTYYRAEAIRKVSSILKHPTFRPDRDADVGRVLNAIQSGKGGSLADERSQLKATINECVQADSLRDFLSSDQERRDFFSTKTKSLTANKMQISNLDHDLRSDVAERIYEIRCKIVHTKSDNKNSSFEALLPFSPEAEQLHHDIELVEFISQQVLIAASASFNNQ